MDTMSTKEPDTAKEINHIGPCGLIHETIEAAVQADPLWMPPATREHARPFTTYCVRCSNRSRCHGESNNTNTN